MASRLLSSFAASSICRNASEARSQVPKWLLPLLKQTERNLSALPEKGRGPYSNSQSPLSSLTGVNGRSAGFRVVCSCASIEVQGAELEVGVIVEGQPLRGQRSLVEEVATNLQEDAIEAVRRVLAKNALETGKQLDKEMVELSVVLCDDAHIKELNSRWRGVDRPTDVLSFPMEDDEGLPVMVLGDLVISLDTALKQAQDRGYDLATECRVLLVHGLLHLMGYDHDLGDEEWERMSKAESDLMLELGWQGKGLISAAEASLHDDSGIETEELEQGVSNGNGLNTSVATTLDQVTIVPTYGKTDVRLVALDMDGTLLDSRSKIRESSKKAILAAIKKGVKVMLATGKARPAAITACQQAGLAGDGLVVSQKSAGVFLQGLAVHNTSGELLGGPHVPRDIVASALQYGEAHDVPCIAFLGDECAAVRMTPEARELHERYYEPLVQIYDSPSDLSQAAITTKKILFMTQVARIQEEVWPYWSTRVGGGTGAALMQAVPTMLELVPEGINKWVGLSRLLGDIGVHPEGVMAVGDGGNDLELVKGAGLGVAMGNAVDEVLNAADVVVGSNDEDGVAEALEKFVL